MKIIDKLAWIEIKERKILSTKTFGKEKFYIPGGKREFGESDEEALIREISEELTVKLNRESLKFIGVFEAQADSHPQGVKVKMTCYSGDYTGKLEENSEIETLDWLNSDDKNRISEVDKLIFDYLVKENLID